MKLGRRIWRAIQPIGMAMVLTACASPARIDQMVSAPSSAKASETMGESVSNIDVTGGSETNPMWASKVSSDAFQRALENSLRSAGLLSPAGVSGKYHLTADLLGLDQPSMMIDATVRASVRYTLIERTTRKEIFSKVIQTSHTAKFSEAFQGAHRLQLANEGAIRASISALIDELNRL